MKNFKNNGAVVHTGMLCGRMPGVCSVLLLLPVFVFNGCLSRRPINEQTFAFSAPTAVGTNEIAGSRVLGIKTLQVAPPFDGRSFVYRTGEFAYGRDPYAEFLGLPAEILTGPITQLLAGDGCFSDVVKMGSAARPDTLIEINISELYGDIRKPEAPSAVLSMQVILTEAKKGLPGRVLLEKNYSRRIPIKSATAAALMAGWNEGLVEIFNEMASDFRSCENT